MKKIVLAATMTAFASSAFAGGVGGVDAEPEVAVPVVVGTSIGGGALIGAGLAGVAILAVVLSDSSTTTPAPVED